MLYKNIKINGITTYQSFYSYFDSLIENKLLEIKLNQFYYFIKRFFSIIVLYCKCTSTTRLDELELCILYQCLTQICYAFLHDEIYFVMKRKTVQHVVINRQAQLEFENLFIYKAFPKLQTLQKVHWMLPQYNLINS